MANIITREGSRIPCKNHNEVDVQSCKVWKLWENGSQYEEQIILNSGIQYIDDDEVLVFSNVTGKDEGEYICVGIDGSVICSGCLFVYGMLNNILNILHYI